MLWGLDAAYPPNDQRVAELAAAGWAFHGGYIGGRALNVWSLDDWVRITGAGMKPWPIWVSPDGTPSRQQGVDEGNRCLVAMQNLGFAGLVALDTENGLVQLEYWAGFLAAAQAGSAGVVLYGSIESVAAAVEARLFDGYWLAWWPPGRLNMSGPPPPCDMWQFASGDQDDYNVAWDGFAFPGFNPPGG